MLTVLEAEGSVHIPTIDYVPSAVGRAINKLAAVTLVYSFGCATAHTSTFVDPPY